MKAQAIREKFLKFAADKGHAIIPSAPIVPENDPTTLFNIAGMQPLVPYLLGEPHPAGKRLADIQKCIRTVDIDEVGDDSHNTFMEMLGWWSLGDYFKDFTIAMTWELFTNVFGMDPAKLAVTIFAGNDDVPRDKESEDIWKKAGVPEKRIFALGKEDNWWELPGPGPCGPSTEVYYWTGDGAPNEAGPEADERWLELANNVLMQYEKKADGSYVPIAQHNVDTGLGFERIVGVVQGAGSVYDTDLYQPLLAEIRRLIDENAATGPARESERLVSREHQWNQRSRRIIADHLKAAAFMIADGVRPSNVDQGYVLRRLVRRAIRHGKRIRLASPFTAKIADVVIREFKSAYPELERKAPSIRETLQAEEGKFAKTIDRGIREFEKLDRLDGRQLFFLFETYGFPLELSLEELRQRSVKLDANKLTKEYQSAFQAHQATSRAGAEQKFAGGLADDSAETVKLHTATHLLNAALQDVLGEHVKQRGSNITAERLRFDFSHPEKLTEEQLNQVEGLVNEWIKEDLPVIRREMPRSEAERIGAQMEFGHKYPDIVSVYFVGDPASARSKEFCGGPHVGRTGVTGEFKIKKQESVGAGVRRIKAIVA